MNIIEKIKLRHIILGGLSAALLYIAATAFSIWGYANLDEKCKADVAIILGASNYNGKPSPVFAERINHGIWLYENGFVDKLIMTGGVAKGNGESDAYVAKLYAVEQGIPEEDIFIEETSMITQENLENAKVIMDENDFDTAIIVSDPLHMKRAMLVAKDCGIEAYSSPTPTTKYVSREKKLEFLQREVLVYIGYQLYRLF